MGPRWIKPQSKKKKEGEKIKTELKIQLFFNYAEEFLCSDFVLQMDIAIGHILLWKHLHLSQQLHTVFPHVFCLASAAYWEP